MVLYRPSGDQQLGDREPQRLGGPPAESILASDRPEVQSVGQHSSVHRARWADRGSVGPGCNRRGCIRPG